MNLEYYYLFGLDIPLERHSLGVIKQPRLKDFIDRNIAIDTFHTPFIFNDFVVNASGKDEIVNIKNQLGSLKFMLLNCYQSGKADMLDSLKNSIGILYGCEVDIDDKLRIVAGDVIIDDSNFDVLCDLVLEMLKIDKSKIKFENVIKKELSEIEKEFERRRKKYLEAANKTEKKDSLTMLDIANIVIHSKSIDYDKVLNMTIYQLKNSFEVLNIKESFDVSTLYRVSPKFDTSKEKYEHWTEKIKIDKSRLG